MIDELGELQRLATARGLKLVPKLLTTREVAEWLRCSEEMVLRMAARGELKSYRVGSHRRFPEDAVLEMLERSSNNAPTKRVAGRRAR